MEEYKEFYNENDALARTYKINQLSNGNLASNSGTGAPGGVEWSGNANNEYVFGGMWEDILDGDAGNDLVYGFEGDDLIIGGDGQDRLFGDAGDDVLWTGEMGKTAASLPSFRDNGETFAAVGSLSATDGDFASGGSGNDVLYGGDMNEILFGGTGHDILLGF